MNKEILKSAGIDYDNGVKRFLGDSALYEKLLHAFLEGSALERARKAYDDKDNEQLMLTAHEIKGVSGNMDMTVLYKASSALVSLIRSEFFADGELYDCFREFEDAYVKVTTAIIAAEE